MFAKISLISCGAMLISFGLTACDGEQDIKTEASVVRPVKFITISTADTEEVLQFPAVINSSRLSELSLQVGGKLKEFPVKEAQRLKQGDLIARLDQRDFKSAISSAQAKFQNAEEEYKRAVRLAKEDAIARNVLEQRKAQYDVSKAQLDQAEKALTDSVLYAPFDGVVAQTSAKKLQTIPSGQTIIKFIGQAAYKATIDLPASFIANLPKEEAKDEERQAFVLLDAAPNQLIPAKFEEATLIADTASQTYAVTFTFPPPANLNVLPGMNATVELRHNRSSGVPRVAVPLDAIFSDGENNYVWVVDKETMTVSKRSVKIGQGVGQTVIASEGLGVDDTIVGAGAAYLSEGIQVRAWQP